ncbi:hypothetical protein [Burkholderia sp. PU8-34]
MRELKVSEAMRISGAGLVIGGDISGNVGTGGNGGASIGTGIGIGQGANVSINGRPVSPTSPSSNGVGLIVGSSGFDVSKFINSFFKFNFNFKF